MDYMNETLISLFLSNETIRESNQKMNFNKKSSFEPVFNLI